MNKVYVCIRETPEEGKEVETVYDCLDEALAEMRHWLDFYLKDKARQGYFDVPINWLEGEPVKHWGWYDECESYGFYVYERKVKCQTTAKE